MVVFRKKKKAVETQSVDTTDPAFKVMDSPEFTQALRENTPGADVFDWREGDYALVHWTSDGPVICRLWAAYNEEELFKLLPGLRERKAKGYAIWPHYPPEHPMADVVNRMRVR